MEKADDAMQPSSNAGRFNIFSSSSNSRPVPGGVASSTPTSVNSNSEKQSVQLPTICYPSQLPPGAPSHHQMGNFIETASAVAGPQFRSRSQFPGQLQYCRTATFTQLQVAQATFRYPPTPPVDLAESIQQQAQCEQAPTLSHIGYPPLPLPSSGEVLPPVSTCSTEKSSFSLPTPPDLIPISSSDMDSGTIAVSPSTGPGGLKPSSSSSSSYYYQLPWQQSITTTPQDLPSVGDANHHCLATHSHVQAWSGSESASPSPLSLQQRFFFQLPQSATANGQYGDSKSNSISFMCVSVYHLVYACMGWFSAECTKNCDNIFTSD